MTHRRPSFTKRTMWTAQQLEVDRLAAIEAFRQERLQEPLEAYLDEFEPIQDAVEDFLESTVDLSELAQQASTILTDERLLEVARYLPGPPISLDDLQTIADVPSLARSQLIAHPEYVQRLLTTILAGIDRKRFPWIAESREPTEAERNAAILASTALIASQRLATIRRHQGKQTQEERVRNALSQIGMTPIAIPRNEIQTLSQAPRPGQYSLGEVKFGSRKADVVVGLWDERVMPIECKVSNSALNSVKRLNNDAAAKAEVWTKDFGTQNVVPTAVLGGVYNLHNLEEAQQRGLTLYWAHRLEDLTNWIQSTRPQSGAQV